MQEFLFEQPPAGPMGREALEKWWRGLDKHCSELLPSVPNRNDKVEAIRELAGLFLSARLIAFLLRINIGTVVTLCIQQKIKLHGRSPEVSQRNKFLKHLANRIRLGEEFKFTSVSAVERPFSNVSLWQRRRERWKIKYKEAATVIRKRGGIVTRRALAKQLGKKYESVCYRLTGNPGWVAELEIVDAPKGRPYHSWRASPQKGERIPEPLAEKIPEPPIEEKPEPSMQDNVISPGRTDDDGEEDLNAQQLLAVRREAWAKIIIQVKKLYRWDSMTAKFKLDTLAAHAKVHRHMMLSFLYQNPDIVKEHELQNLLAPSR